MTENEKRLIEALQNFLGVFDTPLGFRKYQKDNPFLVEAVNHAKAEIEAIKTQAEIESAQKREIYENRMITAEEERLFRESWDF